MTAISMSQAVKEMEARFRNAWSPRFAAYPNQDFDLPDVDVVWARWACQHSIGSQASLSGVIGHRKWDREGTIIVQVFTPLNANDLLSYDTVEIVVGAYEGKTTPSGVWFRNVRLQEVTKDIDGSVASGNSAWVQKNVLVDFLYDQIH